MQGCECFGQVPGELALQSSDVRDASVTIVFLASFFSCLGGNRLFYARFTCCCREVR